MTKAGEVDTTNETQTENTYKDLLWSFKQLGTKAEIIAIYNRKYTLWCL